MKVMITGGTGFIGAHLSKACVNRGFTTHIYDNNSRGRQDDFINEILKNDNATFFECDLTCKESYEAIDKDYDVVFHLAAINGTENFYNFPYSVMEVALKSTMLLLEHFKGTETQFIFSSSSEVYAGTIKQDSSLIPTPENISCTIEDVTNERFSYGGSKLACEILINSFAKQHGLNFQIIRYHNIYGPRMGTKHVIPQFIYRAKSKEQPFKIYGGNETRAFCYIDDAVDATISLIFVKNKNQILHIGNDQEEIKIRTVAKKIKNLYSLQNIPLQVEHPPRS
jgi:nucleoside-diphosphate-sugar epimerase